MKKIALWVVLFTPALAFAQASPPNPFSSGTSAVPGSAPSYTATAASGSNAFSMKSGARFCFNSASSCTSYLSLSSSLITGSVGFAGPSFTSSAASGANAFGASTNGARFDFGAGASDYASSDGTTVTFAGPTQTTKLGVNTSAQLGGIHLLSAATTTTPAAFTADDLIVGGNAAAGAVFIRYKTSTNTGVVGSLSPGAAWRALNLAASAVNIQDTGGSTVIQLANDGTSTFNGVALFASGLKPSSASQAITGSFTGTLTYDFASLVAIGCEVSTAVTVTGAALGDRCALGSDTDMSALNGSFTCEITGSGAAKVKFCGIDNPPSMTFTVQALH